MKPMDILSNTTNFVETLQPALADLIYRYVKSAVSHFEFKKMHTFVSELSGALAKDTCLSDQDLSVLCEHVKLEDADVGAIKFGEMALAHALGFQTITSGLGQLGPVQILSELGEVVFSASPETLLRSCQLYVCAAYLSQTRVLCRADVALKPDSSWTTEVTQCHNCALGVKTFYAPPPTLTMRPIQDVNAGIVAEMCYDSIKDCIQGATDCNLTRSQKKRKAVEQRLNKDNVNAFVEYIPTFDQTMYETPGQKDHVVHLCAHEELKAVPCIDIILLFISILYLLYILYIYIFMFIYIYIYIYIYICNYFPEPYKLYII